MDYTSDPIIIPPHGHVRFVDVLGTDRTILQFARISYQSASKGDEADQKLLGYLYKNRHTSPFEGCSITYNIKMPIFVMRQFVRHRTFRLNEVSARYTELPDETYLPKSWRIQDTKNKQGSLEYIAPAWNNLQTERAKKAYAICYEEYKAMIMDGVAKEQARMVLPVGIYTEIMVNCDLNNLMKFFTLRLDSHAQGEFRDVAEPMFKIFEQLFPWTAAAWNKYKFTINEQ